jgi:hypothetical protein
MKGPNDDKIQGLAKGNCLINFLKKNGKSICDETQGLAKKTCLDGASVMRVK